MMDDYAIRQEAIRRVSKLVEGRLDPAALQKPGSSTLRLIDQTYDLIKAQRQQDSDRAAVQDALRQTSGAA